MTDNMGGYSMATVSVTIIDGPMVWIGTQATFAEEDYAPAIMNR